MTRHRFSRVSGAAAAAVAMIGSTCIALAADNPETEPNDSKVAATPMVVPLAAGDTISGTSTGAVTTPGGSSVDVFRVQTATGPLGIYRHRLVRTSAGTNGATIRGLNQTGGVIGTTDSTVQTAGSTPVAAQWYGFGKGEQLYFRVTGAAATTNPYQWTYEISPVTPVDIGNYSPGQIVLNWETQGHSTDTDMWVYDSNLDAIPTFGNDDNSVAGGGSGTGLQSRLQRVYSPGTYYIALTNFQFANNQPAPTDDDFQSGVVTDFPDCAVNSSTTTNLNVTFTITDSAANSSQIVATKTAAFEVLWFSFVVQVPPPFGACCFDNGSCVDNQSLADCTTAGGTYSGDGTDCSPNPCPQPGACCFTDGSCQILSAAQCATAVGSYLGNGSACNAGTCLGGCCLPDDSCSVVSPDACTTAGGTFRGIGSNCNLPCNCFSEIEDNNTKAAATTTPALDDGDCVNGETIGSSTVTPGLASADYFKVSLATRPLGIYRHRLEYQSDTPNHTGSIQGLLQSAGVPTVGSDTAIQTATTSTTPQRHVQWYGFGKGEVFYFRVTGVATSTAPYVYQLSSQAVTPQDIGNFAAGEITISTVGQTATDTDLWVYDGSLNAIPDYGNDDESIAGGGTGATLQSILRRNYADGTYYLALSDYNMANNQPSASDEDFLSDAVMDFPDILVEGDFNAAGQDLDFTITDVNGTTNVPALTTEGGFDVLWFKFVVGNPCPGARGDTNCSGGIPDFFDIDPFLLALFDPPAYAATFCGGNTCTVDIDCSGTVDFFDIDPFLLCLFSACPPCP